MRLASVLNRPGPLGKLWRPAYEAGYGLLTIVVRLLFRPLFDVRRVGPPPTLPTGGFLLCANHASYLDPAFLQLVLPRRITFLMTNDFYARPAVRWFFALVGAIPMSAGRLGHAGLRRAAAHLKRGHVVALFPEGRLSRDGLPGPAHRGVGFLARRTGVPVLTVGVRGAFEIWPRGARWFEHGKVRVLFGPLLTWDGTRRGDLKHEEREFARGVMGQIAALARPPDPPPAPPEPQDPMDRP